MRGDNAAVIKSLQPAPSLSRTGRMAELALSTAVLAKSGVAGFTHVKRKEVPPAILVAEVVDASLLDPFGTSEPRSDAGRQSELVSSPRDHPQLVAKQEALRNAEMQESFRRGVGAEVVAVGEDPAARRERLYQERLERHRQMFIMDDDGPALSSNGTSECSSAVFRSQPRIFKPFNIDVPAVGHYRPRYTVVDPRVPGVPAMRSRTAGVRVEALHPSTGSPAAHASPSALPATASLEVSMRAGSPKLTEGAEGPESNGDGRPSDRPSTMRKLPTGQAQADVPDLGRRESPVRESHMFRSASPSRPPPPNTFLDKWYYPYNEALVQPRVGKGAFVEFDRQLDRTRHRGASVEAHSMDIVYNTKDPEAWKAKGLLPFDVSLPRDHKTGSLFQLAQPDPQNCYHGGESYPIEDARRSSPTPGPDFKRTSQKERDPFLSRPNCKRDGPYDIQETERSLKSRRSPAWRLDSQTERPPLRRTEHHDLTYDADYGPVHRSVPHVQFDHMKPHRNLWDEPITGQCNYEPNDAAVRPRTPAGVDFGKALAREAAGAGRAPPPPLVDRVYDADSPLRRPRLTGDPMMRTHLSRDKRTHAFRPANCSPDAFYDYDVEKVLPRHGPGGPPDFGKTSVRTSLGPGGSVASQLRAPARAELRDLKSASV